MGHALHDLARHNTWAADQLLTYCQGLDEATLQATTPGTYGTVIETLRHMIDSEAFYLFRLTGAWPTYPWSGDEAVGLDVLSHRAAVLGATWDQFLAGAVDTERLGEARGDDGRGFAVRAGVFIAQAVHHANEHRAHICTILGALGHEPPDVSAWGYALATGRMTPTSGPPAG
ncbi:MAG: DinB family protein [Chloroflexi bacterium]|nr:DinB family protein [Chloroflexota bacterium]